MVVRSLEEARKLFLRWVFLYALQVLLCVFVGLCVLHMLNTYPRFHAPNAQAQVEAEEFWTLCQTNPYIRSSKHAACSLAQQEAASNEIGRAHV